MLLYVIIAILFFGLLVGIHELGHFTVAKLCNIRVEEFSVGMGPAIWKKQRGETLYALRCVPFGGYCAMSGEDGESEDPRAFVNAKLWQRIAVLAAGSFMNLLLGFVLVFVVFSGAAGYQAPVIDSFMAGCPYESPEAFQAGDRFIRIDGHRVYATSDISDFLAEGEVHDVVLKRNGEKVKLNGIRITKIEYPEEGGAFYGFRLGFDEANFATHVKHTWDQTMEFARWVFMGLKELVKGKVSADDLSGPVGIVSLMAESGEAAETAADAFFNIAYLGAFIAVNLAVMNLLPIPALDGGRIFTVLITAVIELITRKKLDPKYESYIHAAGMILLLALMAFIMFNDVWRLIGK